MDSRLIRLPEVCALVGMQRSTIYNRINNGDFPKPVSLGGRIVAWDYREIQIWIDDVIEASRT